MHRIAEQTSPTTQRQQRGNAHVTRSNALERASDAKITRNTTFETSSNPGDHARYTSDKMRTMTLRLAIFMALVAAGVLIAGCGESTPRGAVHFLRTDDEVGPVMEQYIDRGITRAEDNDAKLVVIELDTPGGREDSMRDIVQRIERAKVPVVVYVYPDGGRAASAGTFITMAANVAVMAPNTSIGAASAINADGSDIGGTLGKKIENDAVSFIRGIAELRGRNADWGEQAVRNAISANQTEAVNQNVVNFVANNETDLLKTLQGAAPVLGKAPNPPYAGVVDAPQVRTNMSVWEKFLDVLADPTLASILIGIGFFGLVFELANPGLVFPGVMGLIALVLGFLGFGTLEVHTAGLVLIALALLFFALELYLPSGGVLGVGGIISLVLGAIIAFHDTPASVHPSKIVLIVLGFFIVGMFVSIASGVARIRKLAAPMGTNELLGKVGIARTPLTPEGFVIVHGERWQAHAQGESVQEGDRVRIVGAEGFRLQVQKEDER
jgi:membrane-bound serine protease (ClpP class)